MAPDSVSDGGPVRRPPMPWWLVAFCWTVMRLNYLPRYGRYYTAVRHGKEVTWDGPHWAFTRHGFWGLNILIKMKLFFRYEMYMNQRGYLPPIIHHKHPEEDNLSD